MAYCTFRFLLGTGMIKIWFVSRAMKSFDVQRPLKFMKFSKTWIGLNFCFGAPIDNIWIYFWSSVFFHFSFIIIVFFQRSALTSLVSQLVSTFSYETRGVAHKGSNFLMLTKRVSFFCLRNECSKTSFWPLLTKQMLTKLVLTKRI